MFIGFTLFMCGAGQLEKFGIPNFHRCTYPLNKLEKFKNGIEALF